MKKFLLLVLFGVALCLGADASQFCGPLPCDVDVDGPATSVDGNVAVFDGTSGHKIKDSGETPDADDVTDDNVESMTTAGAADTVPRSQGGGTLAMEAVYDKTEVDALFAANIPTDAIGTGAMYGYDTNGQYSTFDSTNRALCATTVTEYSDELGEWTNLPSTVTDAPDCDGGGADKGIGLCYTPDGWDEWDSDFHSTDVPVDLTFQLLAWIGYWDGDSYEAVNEAAAYFRIYSEDAACTDGTCNTPGEAMNLVAPTNADDNEGNLAIPFDGIDWDTGPGGSWANGVNPALVMISAEVNFRPGTCALLFQQALRVNSAGGDTDPNTISTLQWKIFAREPHARSDRPRICSHATSASLGGRCLDNAIVLMTGTGAQTFTLADLPASPDPLCVTIINQGGATLTVTPDASDTIEGEAQGASLSNSTQYDKVQLCNNVAAFWSIMGKTGTW